jgi:hypothetical protein
MMSLDLNSLLLSLVTGGVGMVLFVYGKKQQRWPHMVAGVLFMIYPYFVESAGMMFVVGLTISVGLWWAVRSGW